MAEKIKAYEVVSPTGEMLPAFTAGSHIDVFLPDGKVRQYSLCNDPDEQDRYVFAVQWEELGRGGSKAIHENVQVGQVLTISNPRNNFPLVSGAERHLFIAGGIGITPIMSMIRALLRSGSQFTLHYCTRTKERTAFLDVLTPLAAAKKAFFYYDGGDPTKGVNLQSVLSNYVPGTHLYYCGPAGLMAAIAKAASHWPRAAVHYEHFALMKVPPAVVLGSPSEAGETAFQVRAATTGASFDVPSDKSIVQVLRENGIDVPTSCESGLCGTCRLRYLEGIPDHRDYILSDDEKTTQILVCCSRSKSPILVLDI